MVRRIGSGPMFTTADAVCLATLEATLKISIVLFKFSLKTKTI